MPFAKRVSEGQSLDPLTPFRLAVLSNSTSDMTIPPLVSSAARHGIALEVIQPSYDQVAQEALNPDSKVNRSKPDAVLLALDYRGLPLKLSLGDNEIASTTVQGVMDYLRALRNGIKANSNAVCIFQSLAPPAEGLFGSLDRVLPGTRRNLIDHINRELAEFVLGSGDVLLDVAAIAETVGLADWHNPQLWNMGKFAFSDELIPLLCRSRGPHSWCHSREEPEGSDSRPRQHGLGRNNRRRWLGRNHGDAGRCPG